MSDVTGIIAEKNALTIHGPDNTILRIGRDRGTKFELVLVLYSSTPHVGKNEPVPCVGADDLKVIYTVPLFEL